MTVLPADGNSRGVQLRTQTVDALIVEDSSGIWADTEVMIQLHNPSRQQVVLPITLAGPQTTVVRLPDRLTTTVDNQALLPLPVSGTDASPALTFSAPITLPVKSTVTLRMSYRQALPLSDGIAVFTYPLASAAAWPGVPESLRVTVRFRAPLEPEQLLGFAPTPVSRGFNELTWHWERKDPSQNTSLAYLGPTEWTDLQRMRAATTAPDASLAARLELIGKYKRLAEWQPPFGGDTGLFDRYYPMAVAALKAGVAAADAVGDLAAEAHLELAALYDRRAASLTEAAANDLRELAAEELAAASTLRPTDVGLRSIVSERYKSLMEAARERGDEKLAAQHQARLIALGAGQAVSESLGRAGSMARALEATAAGDFAAARTYVSDAFGPDATYVPGVTPPKVGRALVTVTTSQSARKITVALTPSGEPAVTAAMIRRAATALAPWGRVEASGDGLSFTLPFTETAALSRLQTQAAVALPQEPEWALLAAALQPRLLTIGMGSPAATASDYVEFVDLGTSLATWISQAERLENAAQEQRPALQGGSSQGEEIPLQQLAQVQRALWEADAAAWRALAVESRVVYRLDFGAQSREWVLAPGDVRALEAQLTSTAPGRLTIAAAAFLPFLMALILWRKT